MKDFMDHIEMLSLLNQGYRPIDVAYNKYVRFVEQCEQGNIPRNKDNLGVNTCALCHVYRSGDCVECPLHIDGNDCNNFTSLYRTLSDAVDARIDSETLEAAIKLRDKLYFLSILEFDVGTISIREYPTDDIDYVKHRFSSSVYVP